MATAKLMPGEKGAIERARPAMMMMPAHTPEDLGGGGIV
jgi:hypothetical protein